MRIAVITNATSAAQGGAGQIAALYTEALKLRGHEIRTWTAARDFFQLSQMNLLQKLWFHFTDFFSQQSVMKEIVEWKPDVLLTHNLTGCGFATPSTIHAKGVRWVHVLHDVQLIEPSGQIVEGESAAWARWIVRWMCACARRVVFGELDAVVSPTQWLLDFHRKFGFFKRARQVVIANPLSGSPELRVTGRTFSRGSDLSETAKNASPGRTRLIFIGRLDPDKGIDLLLEAWSMRKDRDAKLVIVGEGSWRTRIERMRDFSIDFRGPLPHDDVLSLLAQCSGLVVPSRVWENQPTVILEALAAGCRVVASNVGGIKETLGGAGWTVSPNSASDLADAMHAALHVQENDTEQEAAQRVLRTHEPERVVDALEAVLKSNL